MFTWLQNYWNLLQEDTYVYLDPPYPLSSRKSQELVYDYELTDEQHLDLLPLIKAMPCMVGISTYKNELYAKALKNWNLHTFTSQTRKGPATEYFYYNYPEPTVLHEYTYLGKDYIDRQRIKRKIQREVNKLTKLPVLERNAILEGISMISPRQN